LKLKPFVLFIVLAFAITAHAQGFLSNLSIGVGGEGVFPSSTFLKSGFSSGNFNNPPAQTTSNSLGGIVDARYDFGHHSALGLAVSFNRATEYYVDSEATFTHVKSNNVEIIGTYIFRLPSNERVKPYAMFGGGLVHFGPVTGYDTTGTPESQMKAAFAYGMGTDLRMTDRVSLRLQYRGLVRTDPDFKLYSSDPGGFGTQLRAHVPEPSIQLVYHF
jgi:opacity protein-like surface antigen